MICVECQRVLVDPESHEPPHGFIPRIPHHLTWGSFMASVESGCYACSAIWATLAPDERRLLLTSYEKKSKSASDVVGICQQPTASDFAEKPVTWLSWAYWSDPSSHIGSYIFYLKSSGVLKGRGSRPLHPCFMLQPHSDFPDKNVNKTLAPTTKSAQSLSFAKERIADCTANHKCVNVEKKNWYPTRLLDCGYLEDSGTCCRLINTNTSAINGPYITLSHCWGTTDCLRLTDDNYAELHQEFPLSLLPQLYQDAVYVARHLNVRYLWIDSLCIIQQGDNFLDWRHEVSLMHEVYSNSFCTISAADAPDSNHSMFSSRNPDSLHPEIVRVSVDGQTAPYLLSETSFWKNNVSHSIINRRAWVVQERLLSSRVLYFGAHQVLWECCEKEASESYPNGLSPPISSPYMRLKKFHLHHDAQLKANDGSASYQIWAEIVRAYTACDLTFSVDKLPALSAIASAMQAILCDEYVAGMWRRHLEYELLWVVISQPSGALPRPELYRAPSWSWASVDGAIFPGLPDFEASDVQIRVESLHLDSATVDPTSMISGGWLRLQGLLKKLTLTPYGNSTPPSGLWNMEVNGTLIDMDTGSDYFMVVLDAAYEHFHKQNAEASLYCMLGSVPKTPNDSIKVFLLELDDREKGIFHRIGIALGRGMHLQEMMLANGGEEGSFPCETYKNGLHSIIIV